jgi:hypothetical protein
MVCVCVYVRACVCVCVCGGGGGGGGGDTPTFMKSVLKVGPETFMVLILSGRI